MGYDDLTKLEMAILLDKSDTIEEPDYHYNQGWNDAMHEMAQCISEIRRGQPIPPSKERWKRARS